MFSGCSSLTEIVFSDRMTNIPSGTLSNCTSLASITIPTSVNTIGNGCFEGCSGLTDVYYNGYVREWDAITIGANNEPLAEAALHFPEYMGSGKCGDQVDWFLDPQETLTISGSGEMYSYTSASSVPWNNMRAHIRKIVILDGVTSIGEFVFSGLSNLTDITIPAGVTSIGSYAFSSCSSLTEISIPDSVTRIGDYAFSSCINLTDITIPAGVTSIGAAVFRGCSSLVGVTIPTGVTSIGSDAFRNCSALATITIPDSVTSFTLFGIVTLARLVQLLNTRSYMRVLQK